jgi:hypothetical protein
VRRLELHGTADSPPSLGRPPISAELHDAHVVSFAALTQGLSRGITTSFQSVTIRNVTF